jgi:hypothetical protein
MQHGNKGDSHASVRCSIVDRHPGGDWRRVFARPRFASLSPVGVEQREAAFGEVFWMRRNADQTCGSVAQRRLGFVVLLGNVFSKPAFVTRHLCQRRTTMKKLLGAAVLVAFITPAHADFYVVQDVKTKKCTIVDQKPTTTETTVVGNGTVYKTREEATTGMKSVKVCTEK